MYSIRRNGDNIAQEFNRLLSNNQNIVKTAQDSGGNVTDDVLKDLLVSNAEDESDKAESDNVADLESQVQDMADYADDDEDDEDSKKEASMKTNRSRKKARVTPSGDPLGHYIMSGLGKIAASLRNKNEGFAADVVEATAFSIREDLTKESNRKSNIASTLNKMASDFQNSGDGFAADMVKATVRKISS
jgi:DNA-binding ferritin-like protein